MFFTFITFFYIRIFFFCNFVQSGNMFDCTDSCGFLVTGYLCITFSKNLPAWQDHNISRNTGDIRDGGELK